MPSLDALWWRTDTNKNGRYLLSMRAHQKMSVSTDVSMTREKPSPSADELPSRTRHAPRCNLSTANAVSPVTPREQRSGNFYPYSTAISLLPCWALARLGRRCCRGVLPGKSILLTWEALPILAISRGRRDVKIQGAKNPVLWFGLFELLSE
jgi:hypothetical protein